MGLLDWLGTCLGKRWGQRPPPHIDPALWQRTLARSPFLAALPPADASRLRALAEGFLASKEFSAAGGLVLSDDICVSIAAQGCLPVLNLGLSAYADWVGIVVYPDEFSVPRQVADESGVVHEYTDVLSGEAWEGGPLLLSWQDVQAAGAGYNVVIHEFAHKLDMLNGMADGIPPLHSGLDEAAWEDCLLAAYDDFCAALDAGQPPAIDPYAADDPAEFFAVCSEVFFETPQVLQAAYPAFYALLARYYRQDPATRLMKSPIADSTAAS